jgi:hypothetical protein
MIIGQAGRGALFLQTTGFTICVYELGGAFVDAVEDLDGSKKEVNFAQHWYVAGFFCTFSAICVLGIHTALGSVAPPCGFLFAGAGSACRRVGNYARNRNSGTAKKSWSVNGKKRIPKEVISVSSLIPKEVTPVSSPIPKEVTPMIFTNEKRVTSTNTKEVAFRKPKKIEIFRDEVSVFCGYERTDFIEFFFF